MSAYKQEGSIQLEYLFAYSAELNPDEQVCNHAKARLIKRQIFTKEEIKSGLLAILHSVQKQTSLIKSFFRMKETQYILDEAA